MQSSPKTARPTTARPTTARPTTARPNTARPNTARPNTARPTTSASQRTAPTTISPLTQKVYARNSQVYNIYENSKISSPYENIAPTTIAPMARATKARVAETIARVATETRAESRARVATEAILAEEIARVATEARLAEERARVATKTRARVATETIARVATEARLAEERARVAEARARVAKETRARVAEARARVAKETRARVARARVAKETRARAVKARDVEAKAIVEKRAKVAETIARVATKARAVKARDVEAKGLEDMDDLVIDKILKELFKFNSSILNSDYLDKLKLMKNNVKLSLNPLLKNLTLPPIEQYSLDNITKIDLSNIVIDEFTVKVLNWTVEYSKVSTIILSNITFKNHDVATKFLIYLEQNTQIEVLTLQNIEINKKNLNNLLNIIEKLTNIVWLEFSGFNIIHNFDKWDGVKPSRYDVTSRYDVSSLSQANFEYPFLRILIKLEKLQMLIFNNNIISGFSYYYFFNNKNIIKIIADNEEYNIDTSEKTHMIIIKGKIQRTLRFSTKGNNMDLLGKNHKFVDYDI